MTPADWWPHFMWFPMFPFLFMLLGLGIFLVVMMPMMRRHGPWSQRRDDAPFPNRGALNILNERYAKGEIQKSEYDDKRRMISQGG